MELWTCESVLARNTPQDHLFGRVASCPIREPDLFQQWTSVDGAGASVGAGPVIASFKGRWTKSTSSQQPCVHPQTKQYCE